MEAVVGGVSKKYLLHHIEGGCSHHHYSGKHSSSNSHVTTTSVSALHQNKLSILYYNACSLLPKIEYLAATCLACNPDIVRFVESWLCSDIDDNEVSLHNYLVVRLDINRAQYKGVLFCT